MTYIVVIVFPDGHEIRNTLSTAQDAIAFVERQTLQAPAGTTIQVQIE